jgi:hypothetical protein
VENRPNLVFYAVNCNGVVCSSPSLNPTTSSPSSSTNTSSSITAKSVTALTWGVFPNKEILQPTIFDPTTFLVWSQEAFNLWTSAWAALYDDETDSSALIYEVCHVMSCLLASDSTAQPPFLHAIHPSSRLFTQLFCLSLPQSFSFARLLVILPLSCLRNLSFSTFATFSSSTSHPFHS